MFQRILVPIDGSAPAQAGLQEAIDIAVAHGSELVILHVVDDSPGFDDFQTPGQSELFRQRQLAKGARLLDEAMASCHVRGLQAQTRLHLRDNERLPMAIVGQAVELRCDLIVIGSHGRRGVGRAILGSEAEEVLRASPVPVLLIHDSDDAIDAKPVTVKPPYRRIIVPVDGSDTSDLGLAAALRLASANGGRIRLVHVVDELSMAAALDPAVTVGMDWVGMLQEGGSAVLALAAERVQAAGIPFDTLLVDDFKRRVWEVVADDAREWPADLVVVGSHGRRGAARFFLGSDAEQIARRSPVPVLVVGAGPTKKSDKGPADKRQLAELAA